MKELIQLFQIWKDQRAIKPNGLLKDNDIQMLIDKMVADFLGSAKSTEKDEQLKHKLKSKLYELT